MGPDRPIRFFASGEYGERRQRPHYHEILYGVGLQDAKTIQSCWNQGHTYTVEANWKTIAYTAGYTAKKLQSWEKASPEEQVDPETGEVYTWQPPFKLMSRRPGIGGHAREHTNSWRAYAVLNGQRQPVPRFLHQAWKDKATAEQQEQLEWEKYQRRQNQINTLQMLQAAEELAIARQAIKDSKQRRNQNW